MTSETVIVRMVRGEQGKPPWDWKVSPAAVPALEGSYRLTADGTEVSAADAAFLCDEANSGAVGGRRFAVVEPTPAGESPAPEEAAATESDVDEASTDDVPESPDHDDALAAQLPDRVIEALTAAGFTAADLPHLSDDDLLTIQGIGRSTLADIRQVVPAPAEDSEGETR